jgi:Mn2+/Fe2+ NRAMP family transporter
LSEPFGRWGYYLFAASLGIACFGACMEQALETSYVAAQAFGWNLGESKRPAESARFSIVYTLGIFSSALLMVIGLDPLKLTMFSMALTALMLPIVVVPLLVLMNDRRYLGEHTNRWFSNGIVGAVLALTCVIAIVAIPLEYFGG